MFEKKRRQTEVAALVLAVVLGILPAACKTSGPKPDQVTLQLNWYHEAEFAGYYVAEAKGFYTDENLDVVIQEGGMDVSAPRSVLDGEADFGVSVFDKQRRRVGKNEPLVAVMAAFQIPPPVLFALADSGIEELRDLVGRRVGV